MVDDTAWFSATCGDRRTAAETGRCLATTLAAYGKLARSEKNCAKLPLVTVNEPNAQSIEEPMGVYRTYPAAGTEEIRC